MEPEETGTVTRKITPVASKLEDERKVMFERAWNERLGKSVSAWTKSDWKKEGPIQVEPGVSEYVVAQLYACRIRLRVNSSEETLLSWSYASSQKNCVEYYYAPGA